jgi:hypothetical protein
VETVEVPKMAEAVPLVLAEECLREAHRPRLFKISDLFPVLHEAVMGEQRLGRVKPQEEEELVEAQTEPRLVLKAELDLAELAAPRMPRLVAVVVVVD